MPPATRPHVTPATPRRRALSTRPRCSNRWSGAFRAGKSESMKNSKQPPRPPHHKDHTSLARAGALLLMAGLLYLLWPSAETAYLAMESVIR